MIKKQIKVGIGDAVGTANDFVDACKRTEHGKVDSAEHKSTGEKIRTRLQKCLLSTRQFCLTVSPMMSGYGLSDYEMI